MTDTRCVYCNWLNREVGFSFVCENCGEDNTATLIKEEKEEEKVDTQYNSKRRAK